MAETSTAATLAGRETKVDQRHCNSTGSTRAAWPGMPSSLSSTTTPSSSFDTSGGALRPVGLNQLHRLRGEFWHRRVYPRYGHLHCLTCLGELSAPWAYASYAACKANSDISGDIDAMDLPYSYSVYPGLKVVIYCVNHRCLSDNCSKTDCTTRGPSRKRCATRSNPSTSLSGHNVSISPAVTVETAAVPPQPPHRGRLRLSAGGNYAWPPVLETETKVEAWRNCNTCTHRTTVSGVAAMDVARDIDKSNELSVHSMRRIAWYMSRQILSDSTTFPDSPHNRSCIAFSKYFGFLANGLSYAITRNV